MALRSGWRVLSRTARLAFRGTFGRATVTNITSTNGSGHVEASPTYLARNQSRAGFRLSRTFQTYADASA